MKKSLSLILPTYDEAPNIRPLIDEIIRVLNDIHEIIVVDDNSPDGTSDIVGGMIKTGKYPFLKLERRRETRKSLAMSIQRGIELATGDAIGWMDCDFSMPPNYLPVLLSFIDIGYDIAVGSRFVLGGKEEKDPSDKLPELILSRCMNAFIRICLDHKFKDFTSGFVVSRKEIFNTLKLRGDYGEYFVDFIYQALRLKYRIVEAPYIWVPRKAGYSKTGANLYDYCKRGWKYIVVTLKLLCQRSF